MVTIKKAIQHTPIEANRASVVFVFPGHGAQRTGMTSELLAASPRFAEYMRECDHSIAAETGWSLLALLRSGELLAERGRIQPALWAVQVSLARLWRDWGVEPDVVVGYSMGEIAAAVISGALSVAAGAALVCRRGLLLDTVHTQGDMWAVGLGEAAASDAISLFADRVCVAAVNTDQLTILSGDSAALAEVVAPLIERKVLCRKLNTGGAGHSPHVDPVLPALVDQLGDLRPGPAAVRMYSTALDRFVDGAELTADYWGMNLRQPVRFASACAAVVCGRPPALFVEVSPQQVLVGSVEENVAAARRVDTVLPSLRRGRSDLQSLQEGLAVAQAFGCGSTPSSRVGTRSRRFERGRDDG